MNEMTSDDIPRYGLYWDSKRSSVDFGISAGLKSTISVSGGQYRRSSDLHSAIQRDDPFTYDTHSGLSLSKNRRTSYELDQFQNDEPRQLTGKADNNGDNGSEDQLHECQSNASLAQDYRQSPFESRPIRKSRSTLNSDDDDTEYDFPAIAIDKLQQLQRQDRKHHHRRQLRKWLNLRSTPRDTGSSNTPQLFTYTSTHHSPHINQRSQHHSQQQTLFAHRDSVLMGNEQAFTAAVVPNDHIVRQLLCTEELYDHISKSCLLTNEENVTKFSAAISKEWKARKAEGKTYNGIDTVTLDTPLALAIKQGRQDVASIMATYHAGDWEAEVYDSDTTILLFCLKTGTRWQAIARQMTWSMSEQMVKCRAQSSNKVSRAVRFLMKMEPRGARRICDITNYLSRTTTTSLGSATALHLAAYYGLNDVIAKLLLCGMPIDSQVGAKFYTPLCFAIIGEKAATVAFLLDHGANPNLNLSSGTVATLATTIETTEIIQILLEPRGSQGVNIVRSNRKQMLRRVVQLNKPHLIPMLSKGCDVDDKTAVACFRYAIASGFLDIARQLVRHGAVLNATDAKGNTPLILAVRGREINMVKTLLQRNADTDARNSENQSFWNYVLKQVRENTLNFDELSAFFDWQILLLKAATLNDMESFMFLLTSTDCDITRTDDCGENVWHHAAKNGCNKLFALLKAAEEGNSQKWLKAGFQCNQSKVKSMVSKCLSELGKANHEGKTPLLLACEAGSYATVRYLVKHAGITSKDNSGKTVLHYIAANSKGNDVVKIVKWLMAHYSNDFKPLINMADKDGNTPLHIAVKRANIDIVRMLSTADPNQVNNDGLSPFQCALLEQSETFFRQFLDTIESNDQSHLNLHIFLDSHVNQMPLLHNMVRLCNENLVRLLIAKGANALKKDRTGNTVLHHIAQLKFESKHFSHRHDLLNVALAIIDEVTVSRHHRELYLKNITGGRDGEKPSFERLKIFFYLTRCVPNAAGQSVLIYAGSLGAAAYVEWMLQPIAKDDGVKLANDNDVVCSAAYDVTFLTPQCVKWAEYKGNGSGMPKRISLLEAILNNDTVQGGTKIFDLYPMAFLQKKFISAYQWFYVLVLCLHIVYMSLLTYFSYSNLVPIFENIDKTTKNRSTDEAWVNLPGFNDVIGHSSSNNALFIIWPLLLCIFNFVNVKSLFRQHYLSGGIHDKLLDKDMGNQALRLLIIFVGSLPFYLHFILTLAWYLAIMQCNFDLATPLKYAAFICGFSVPIMAVVLYSKLTKLRKRLKLSNLKLGLILTPFLCNLFLFLGISMASTDCPSSSNAVSTTAFSRRYYGFFLLLPSLEVLISVCLTAWYLTKITVTISANSYHFLRAVLWFCLRNLYILGMFTMAVVVIGWYASCTMNSHRQIYYLAAALIVGWNLTIHFTHCFRGYHLFGIVLKQSLFDDSVRFAVIYIFVTAGFACAMNVLFYDFPEMLALQPTPLDTMYESLKVTVGLGDLVDSGLDFGSAHYYSYPGWVNIKLVYIIYINFSNIVLLNIVIAMVTRTYETMVRREVVTWHEWRYNNIMFVMRLPQRIRAIIEYIGSTDSMRARIKTMPVGDEFTMLILLVNDTDHYMEFPQTTSQTTP